jgi:hypothetical protein
MKATIHDTTLSSLILSVTKDVLPLTEPGITHSSAKAHDAVVKLAHALKLATLMEHELAMHRHGEVASAARSVMTAEAMTSFEQMVHDPKGTVVKLDFDGGRKK